MHFQEQKKKNCQAEKNLIAQVIKMFEENLVKNFLVHIKSSWSQTNG